MRSSSLDRVTMRMRSVIAASLSAVIIGGVLAPLARADGDPGSDVLVYQDLFVGSTAGLSVPQQAQLGELLKAAERSKFPIRVAIIGSRADLGAVTALWRKPQAYARFLGLELSLAYKQRLLVVMPNGLGFNWPGHSSGPAYRTLAGIQSATGGDGLLSAAEAGVRRLAAADGVKLPSAPTTSQSAPAPSSGGSATTPPGRSVDRVVGTIAVGLLALAAAALMIRWALRRRAGRGSQSPARQPRRLLPSGGRRWVLPSVVLLGLVLTGAVVALADRGHSGSTQRASLAFNPTLDPGTPLSGAAPDFTLSDQFGRPVSLHSFRGKVVILAFNDSECTTVCPLTTSAMLQAKAMLGKAGSQVQLLGVDANPHAIALENVWSYSELHGMLDDWHFLTGSLPELKRVWKQYAVEAAVEAGEITHTPALFVIDPEGHKAKVYITQMSYSSIGQLGQLLAGEASRLLPGHPAVRSDLSYARVPGITPEQTATLPRAGGGTVQIGPGKSAHLYVFFATWDRGTSALGGQLSALNGYAAAARRLGLPPLTAVDEGSVEPSSQTLNEFLARLPHPLSYPTAIDQSGRIADGYQVLGVPWFVLTSKTGQILYYREVSTAGWPSTHTLISYVRAALARTPKTPSGGAQSNLAQSPPALAALHQQANQLVGSEPDLEARVHALRGYPIVINAWASWCGPCRAEFGLFASASARYGSRVAFIGANNDDSATNARGFLSQHPVRYPSYETTTSNLRSLAVVQGLPTTIFINRAGKVAFVHTGQYDSQGTLDHDIGSYALGG
jgi:cytochrome oxidase Cu insertion factor (SCO1/SenC/PrrC family)/thiol-disulfide isomerase/thioredoxin